MSHEMGGGDWLDGDMGEGGSAEKREVALAGVRLLSLGVSGELTKGEVVLVEGEVWVEFADEVGS